MHLDFSWISTQIYFDLGEGLDSDFIKTRNLLRSSLSVPTDCTKNLDLERIMSLNSFSIKTLNERNLDFNET